MNSFAISPTRRQFLLLGTITITSGVSHASTALLPVPDLLSAELALALKNNGPLLVMVSLEGCPFCKIARENYLAPLQQQTGLAVVQIDLKSQRLVRDFNGNGLTQDGLARQWGVKVAPTVLFFGRGGIEVAERLVGGYIPDFYGAYLDERVRIARAAIVA